MTPLDTTKVIQGMQQYFATVNKSPKDKIADIHLKTDAGSVFDTNSARIFNQIRFQKSTITHENSTLNSNQLKQAHIEFKIWLSSNRGANSAAMLAKFNAITAKYQGTTPPKPSTTIPDVRVPGFPSTVVLKPWPGPASTSTRTSAQNKAEARRLGAASNNDAITKDPKHALYGKALIVWAIDKHWPAIKAAFNLPEQMTTPSGQAISGKGIAYAMFFADASVESADGPPGNVRFRSEWETAGKGFGLDSAHAYGVYQTAETGFSDAKAGWDIEKDVPEITHAPMQNKADPHGNFYDPYISTEMGIRKFIHFAKQAKASGLVAANDPPLKIFVAAAKGHNTGHASLDKTTAATLADTDIFSQKGYKDSTQKNRTWMGSYGMFVERYALNYMEQIAGHAKTKGASPSRYQEGAAAVVAKTVDWALTPQRSRYYHTPRLPQS